MKIKNLTAEEFDNFQLKENDFEITMGGTLIKYNSHMITLVLRRQKAYELLKKRIEELVDAANYNEISEEPDCQKVVTMDSNYYCECEYCMYAHELEKILDEAKKIK